MTLDLSKLTPAPWDIGGDISINGTWATKEADWDFIPLARMAFDVMMRRRMYAHPDADGKWIVLCNPHAVDEYEVDDLLKGQD